MKRYSAYIFDQDGTIYLDAQPLPGVVDTISKLRSFGLRTIFLSNNPTKSRDQYAKKLSSIGIPTLEEEIINSSYVLTHWLLKVAPKSRLFVIGEEPLKNELVAAGFVLTEAIHEIDFVVSSFDRTFTYSKLQIAFDAIRSGAKLIATNPDRYCPTQKGGEPDCAAITAAIETCTNTKCEVIIGKPSSIMIEMILSYLKLPPNRCLIIGDRLETDIQMGFDAGMDTCLVLTGDTTKDKLNNSGVHPTYVIEKMDRLLKTLALIY